MAKLYFLGTYLLFSNLMGKLNGLLIYLIFIVFFLIFKFFILNIVKKI